jgi:hypothetical protein
VAADTAVLSGARSGTAGSNRFRRGVAEGCGRVAGTRRLEPGSRGWRATTRFADERLGVQAKLLTHTSKDAHMRVCSEWGDASWPPAPAVLPYCRTALLPYCESLPPDGLLPILRTGAL